MRKPGIIIYTTLESFPAEFTSYMLDTANPLLPWTETWAAANGCDTNQTSCRERLIGLGSSSLLVHQMWNIELW